MGLPRRAGVRAPGLVPIRIRLLDGAVIQPEPHTQTRIHIAVDFKIHAQEIAKAFHVCLLFVGRILIPTSILYATIGRVLTN